MRPLLLLAALVLAGCIAPGPAPGDGPGAAPAGCDLAVLRTRALGLQPCNVEVTTTQGPAAETNLALNPRDARNLVAGAKDFTLQEAPGCHVHNVWAGVYASRDGGATWSNALFPGHPGDDTGPLAAFTCSSDPVVAFGPDGAAYYTGIGVEPTPEELVPAVGRLGTARSVIWVARSDDGGLTWGQPVFVADCQAPACFNDKQWLAIAPDGTVHATWAFIAPLVQDPVIGGAATGHIVASRSTDRGVTWSRMVDVSPPSRGNVLNQFNTPVVTPDGRVFVFWIDILGSTLVFARSDDGGATWSLPAPIAPVAQLPGSLPNSEFRTPTLTTAAAGPDGALYVAWPDYAAGNADIAFVRSTDAGATWTSPAQVNQDAGDHDQFFPALAVAPNGRVDVVFYDRRDDPGNRLVTLYLASSADGGATWDEVRVGDVLFDGDLGYHQAGPPYLGDYIGVASTDAATHAVWADSRNGDNDVFSAAVRR